jgi:hypothetical protein
MDWFGLSGIPFTGLPPATEALRKNATQQLLKNRRYQLVPWCHFRVELILYLYETDRSG